MPLQSKPPLPSALVRPGRRPPGSTVVKRATVKFASDVAQSDVADFASDVRQTGSGPAAPASDRLGELLRLYSELSFERKKRAFDYVSQLHMLETGGGGDESAMMGHQGRSGRLSSPPPPEPMQFGRPRPEPVQVPSMSSYENVGPPVQPHQHDQSWVQPPLQPSAQAPPVQVNLTLTGEQLRGLVAGQADPLDGLVASVFSPQRPQVQPLPMHQQPPPQWGLGGGGGDVNRPMHTSTLRRQMRQPNFDGGGGGGESIYSMLGTEDGMGGGGGMGGDGGIGGGGMMRGTQWGGSTQQWGRGAGGMGGGGCGGYGCGGGAPSMAPHPPSCYAQQPATAPSAMASSSTVRWGGRADAPPLRMSTPPIRSMAPHVHTPQGSPWGVGGQGGACGGGGFGGGGFGGGMGAGGAVVPAMEEQREETRNLHDHLRGGAYAREGGGDPPSPDSKNKGNFMRSLTSMHHSPTNAEAHYAAKKRQDWLNELAAQVDERQRQKQQERLEREMAEMRESITERQMREKADAQLRAELAMRGVKKEPLND